MVTASDAIIREGPPDGNIPDDDLPPPPTLLEHVRGETIGPVDETVRFWLTEAGRTALLREYATGSFGAWRVA